MNTQDQSFIPQNLLPQEALDALNNFDAHQFIERLMPITRSITGKGIQDSLEIIKEYMPLEIIKIKSGTQIFDWTVPQEWELISGELRDSQDNIILSTQDNPMCVLNFSTAYQWVVSREELEKHLFCHVKYPHLTPYATSYYKDHWGFCLNQEQKAKLTDQEYKVDIKTIKKDGYLTYGRCVLKGQSERKVTLTSYLCHPHMLNNELSGSLALVQIYLMLSQCKERYYTYEFIFNPETIGALCVLHNEDLTSNLEYGAVLTCLARKYHEDYPRTLSVKLTRADWLSNLTSPHGDIPIEQNTKIYDVDPFNRQQVADKLLQYLKYQQQDAIFYTDQVGGNSPYTIDKFMRTIRAIDPNKLELRLFTPASGSDERQYCSSNFNLPFIQFTRTEYGTYEEYHTAQDNTAIFDINSIAQSALEIFKLIRIYEIHSHKLINQIPGGEPQLGKRNLYPTINVSGARNINYQQEAINVPHILTILSLLNGEYNVLDIAKIAKLNIDQIIIAYNKIKQGGILD